MKTLTIEFNNEDDGTQVKMKFGAGDPDLNHFFKAATLNYINPHLLAIQLGRITPERETEILMQAYACGVVLETEPAMNEEEVFEWFKSHPDEFDILFGVADHKENFEEDGDPNEPGSDGATTQPGRQGSW